jgi:hypothetical protein
VLLLDKYRYIKVTDVNGNIAEMATVTVEDKIVSTYKSITVQLNAAGFQ